MFSGSVERKCGLVPTKVFLSKGEKRQLVFWTDQDYRYSTNTIIIVVILIIITTIIITNASIDKNYSIIILQHGSCPRRVEPGANNREFNFSGGRIR